MNAINPAQRPTGLVNRKLVLKALLAAVLKLDPRRQIRNPVMFVVWVGAAFTSVLAVLAIRGGGEAPLGFILGVSIWLWFTVFFANLAEAMAEGRGQAQADMLRKTRQDTKARLLFEEKADSLYELVPSSRLVPGEVVRVNAGEMIPCDGVVVIGVASVDESAITGESAPVIRESGGDRDAVTGGTRVLSDWLVIRVTAGAGQSFLDRMIALIEGSKRRKTPNEIALDILLAGLTIVFLVVTATLLPFSVFAVH
ncbi:MAG: potassium-transporting ATPase subunit B, partial [bacterium]